MSTQVDDATNLDDDVIVLPWWQNPLNFLALGLSMLILGIGIGYYFGDAAATSDKNKVDVGFLQDMRYHHDQAVEMIIDSIKNTDWDGLFLPHLRRRPAPAPQHAGRRNLVDTTIRKWTHGAVASLIVSQ